MFAVEEIGQTDERLAANLRAARDRAGISQDDLAERMIHMGHKEFRQQTITRIENGRRKVSYAEAINLARAVGTTADALSRPTGLARDAWRLLDLARSLRAAHEQATSQAQEFASTRATLERALQRMTQDGNAAELADEMSVARRALALELKLDGD